jgi:hypothetical protein
MNFSLPNIIVGIIGIIMGFFLVKEAYYMNHHIYFLDWAEQKWGGGAGTMVYRYVGLGIIIFSMFVILGFFDLFNPTVGPVGAGGSRGGGIAPSPVVPNNNIAP